jgi:formylmethanofuran dehydrogenase subunit A
MVVGGVDEFAGALWNSMAGGADQQVAEVVAKVGDVVTDAGEEPCGPVIVEAHDRWRVER